MTTKHFSRPVDEENEVERKDQNRVDTRRELLYQRAVAGELWDSEKFKRRSVKKAKR